VVALDKDHKVLRPSLLWMDARSAAQTVQILEQCRGDPALNVNCGGEGPLSAEWFIPKCLWLKQQDHVEAAEAEVGNTSNTYEAAHVLCEYQDYINLQLTGELCASSCTAAVRWHWDGEEAIRVNEDVNENEDEKKYPGRPLSLLQKLGMSDLVHKMPQRCIPMGAKVGSLTKDAAARLNLPQLQGLPVAQGGPDAFVGMIGLGCIHPGQLCLITGSSHLHCVVSSEATTAPGTWGAYRGAPIPGICFAEGGQSSTGSILRWMKTTLLQTEDSYKVLDDEAAVIAPGSDGLIALETFQGSRTPVTDARARGALIGLTLSHTRGHIWRSLMEAVCLGTKACVDGLAKAGHACNEIVIAGGATRSPIWLQMHADVTGKPVVVCENTDAPLLGCAILASVCGGVHDSIPDAVQALVREAKRITPNEEAKNAYQALYDQVYSKVAKSVRPIVHSIAELRGGGADNYGSDGDDDSLTTTKKNKQFIVSPSLLASDWANMQKEVERCEKAGLPWIHVDVFDGVFLDSPHALTFGPKMVESIRRHCSSSVILDIHLCVDRPARYVEAMAKAGATRIIFQIEALDDIDEAMRLAREVNKAGMKCGVSLNPWTPVEAIFPLLLDENLVDLVDVLAVEPGFGGQKFQMIALQKIEALKRFREENNSKAIFKILVDGGINTLTANDVVAAGADILVAGTFLFNHVDGIEKALQELNETVSQQ